MNDRTGWPGVVGESGITSDRVSLGSLYDRNVLGWYVPLYARLDNIG